ncbi:MAG: hypothetical protein FJW40_02275 [Acidobacteria bacterium]|nr:hypothetical protein [Acidobacteriota bacterium]
MPRALLVLLVVPLTAADLDLPSPAPVIRRMFPAGLKRGSTVEVEIAGQNLDQARGLTFSGLGVDSVILSSEKTKIRARITAEPSAETGRRDYWLRTKNGSTIGVITVGSLAETNESEPNDDWREAPSAETPVTINGVVGGDDWDHFRVRAQAGQTLVLDCLATRAGSRFDAELAILDESGQEIAWDDDTTIFGDPQIRHRVEKTGTYIIRVSSLAGGANATYRLTLGDVPLVTALLPAGLTTAHGGEITVEGVNLAGIDRVWLGDKAGAGRVLEATGTSVRVRFDGLGRAAPGRYWLHLAAGGLELPTPLEVHVSDLPEVTVKSPPASRQSALAVKPSTVIHGRIGAPGETHYFRFPAKAGHTYSFKPESMRLYYHLDPAITLYDSAGREIAFADDPGVDDRSDEYQIDADLAVNIAESGDYYLAIRDAMHRGGASLIYRLTIEETLPGFILELREPSKSLYANQTHQVQARVRRRGWTQPVEVWLEDLPAGVTSASQTVAPIDTVIKDGCGVDRRIDGSLVWIPISATAAQPGQFAWRLRARGVMNNRTVERDAIVRYENGATGYFFGPIEVQRSEITVVQK